MWTLRWEEVMAFVFQKLLTHQAPFPQVEKEALDQDEKQTFLTYIHTLNCQFYLVQKIRYTTLKIADTY